MTTPPGQDRALRASDADRAVTVRALQDAVVRGLLTPEEGSERMAAAWAAVHVRDLAPLTSDLPPAGPVRGAAGWRVLATMAGEQLRSTLHGVRSGRLSPARVAVALAVVLLLVVLVGAVVGELFFDGPGHGGF